MEVIVTLAVWGSAVFVSHKMAEKRELDTSYAIVGGILFGWLTPLYYIIFRRVKNK